MRNSPASAHVLQKTLNLDISHCCFAELTQLPSSLLKFSNVITPNSNTFPRFMSQNNLTYCMKFSRQLFLSHRHEIFIPRSVIISDDDTTISEDF